MPNDSAQASRSWQQNSPRPNYFLPILIFFFGIGSLTAYHVLSLEDQLSEVTTAIDKLDPQVRHAEYEKSKFYAIARDLVRLAPQNATAEQIVQETNLRKLQRAQPALMSLDLPSGFTNAAPDSVRPPPTANNPAPAGK